MSKKKNIDLQELTNSFNTLAANVKFASIDSNVKTISIVSTVSNEGKTTVAVCLAKALATQKKSCIIVDTDMRKRNISGILNVHPKYGLLSVLSGKCSINEAISCTDTPGLFFLDSEPNIASPIDVINSNMFASLVDYLHDKFDYVIFDLPPITSFVDGALVASLTDATILVIRQNVAKRSNVAEVLEQLDSAKARVIGSVLTFSTNQKKSQYYYAYYDKEGQRVESNKSKNVSLDLDSATKKNANLDTWYTTVKSGHAVERQKAMSNNISNRQTNDNYTGMHARSEKTDDAASKEKNENYNSKSNSEEKSFSMENTTRFKPIK